MSTEPSPFANGSAWCIAGCKSNGIIYAASIDPILLELHIWARSNVQNKWKILTSADYLSGVAPEAHHCLISAAYSEEFGRLDVFVEIRESLAFIFRFFIGPSPNLDRVLTASDTTNIRFDGVSGPMMYFVGETLVICGSSRGHLDLFRLFRIDIDPVDGPTSFKLTQIWSSLNRYFIWCPAMTVVGKKLVLVLGLDVLIFLPADGRSDRPTQWHEPIIKSVNCLLPRIHNHDRESFFSFCVSPSSDDLFCYAMPIDQDTDLDWTVRQGFVRDDGSITTRLISDRISVPNPNASTYKSVVVSANHVHWVHGLTDVLMSKSFTVLSLQSLCLSVLFGKIPFKSCDSEYQALQLGIPRSAWRRYCT